MTSVAPVAPHAGSAKHHRVLAFASHTSAIVSVEMHKLGRDPTEIVSRAVQPALWLLVFGQVFSRARTIPTGSLSYLDFMTPGVLAQSVLFSSIFFGISVIWERDLGVIHKLLASPASRGALVLGKALSAGVRALSQTMIILALATALGVKLRFAFFPLLGVAAAVVLGASLFATFSLVIACLVKTRDRFMGIGQVLTLPLFFASNAIYPISMMPEWLRRVALVNPLTYLVEVLRVLMVGGDASVAAIFFDVAVLFAVFLVLLIIAARLYPTLVR